MSTMFSPYHPQSFQYHLLLVCQLKAIKLSCRHFLVIYPSIWDTTMASDLPLGTISEVLAPELIFEIYRWAVAGDETATLLPQPISPVGAHLENSTNRDEKIWIGSSSAMMRICKVSRSLYYSHLKKHILQSLDNGSLVVRVEDFNFEPVTHALVSLVSKGKEDDRERSLAKIKKTPFTVNLTFSTPYLNSLFNTNHLLAQPRPQNLTLWLTSLSDDAQAATSRNDLGPRTWSFTYSIAKVSITHVENLHYQLLTHTYVRWQNGLTALGPELRKLMDDVEPEFESQSVVREGPRLRVAGEWVKGHWVVWDRREGKGKWFRELVEGLAVPPRVQVVDGREVVVGLRLKEERKRKVRFESLGGM